MPGTIYVILSSVACHTQLLYTVCCELVNMCVPLHFHVGMFAIRAEREYVVNEDFMKAVRKVGDTKKLEVKLDYKQI